MAESSIFWTTGTTGDGTTTYTEAQTTNFFGDALTPNSTITSPHASQGVLAGAGGELAVTGAASPVSVAAGAALTEGYAYRNTAAVTVAIPTPASATRIDRIVLRVSHSTTRTVRITRIAGTEGAGAPALTQVAGTTWDIPLAQCSITTGGVITVTDQRVFCHFATRLDRNQVDGGTAKRIPFNDANGRLTDSADLAFDDASNLLGIGTNTPSRSLHIVGTTNLEELFQLTSGGTDEKYWRFVVNTAAKLFAIDMLDDALSVATRPLAIVRNGNTVVSFTIASQVTVNPTSAQPPLVLNANGQGQLVSGLMADLIATARFQRQGGSATDWSVAGTTNYTPAAGGMQVFAGETQFTSISDGTGNFNDITFPAAFSNKPLMFVTVGGATGKVFGWAQAQSTTVGRVYIFNTSGGTLTTTIAWLAIGPP